MLEQRLAIRLQDYWNLIRKRKEIPDISYFNSAAVEDLWPYCSRLSIVPGLLPGYVCNYMGAPLIDLYGMDLTGHPIERKSATTLGPIVYNRLNEVADARVPVLHDGNFVSAKQNKIVKYHACLLPFGNETRGVTHVIAGMSYRTS